MYAFYQKMNGLYPISEMLVDQAMNHALDAAPEESVGIVAGGQYHRLRNVHPRPLEAFAIDPQEQLRILLEYGTLQVVIHSHPKSQPGPSHDDMMGQFNAGVPYGIIVVGDNNVIDVVFFGDTVPVAPLVGRPFIHGVYDCYALGRDFYRTQLNITLPNFARMDRWWDLNAGEDANLLESNFEAAGFYPIAFNEMKRGDAMLCKLASSQKINHCGVYIGNDLVLHHMYGTRKAAILSIEENVYNWRKFAVYALRHKDAK